MNGKFFAFLFLSASLALGQIDFKDSPFSLLSGSFADNSVPRWDAEAMKFQTSNVAINDNGNIYATRYMVLTGSASQPGLTNSGGGVGISFPDNNNIQFSTAGVQRAGVNELGLYLGPLGGSRTIFQTLSTQSNRTITFPDATGTIALLNQNQFWSSSQTFGTNVSVNGDATFGDASGDTLTINAGTLAAPNAAGITQRGYATGFPDASGKLISTGNYEDLAVVAGRSTQLPIGISGGFRSNGGFANSSASGLIYTRGTVIETNILSPGTMVPNEWANWDFGQVGLSSSAGGWFPTYRRHTISGHFFMCPGIAPNNEGRVILWFGAPTPVSRSPVTITRSGSTATATFTAHGYPVGSYVKISGATEAEYNILAKISNVTANTFDYTVTGTPATPATGTITANGWFPYGWGIVADSAGGVRLAAVNNAGEFVEVSAGMSLPYSFSRRYFWLTWNADGTANLYLAEYAAGATTPPPTRPASPSATIIGLKNTGSYFAYNYSMNAFTTGTQGTVTINQFAFGVGNLQLWIP